MKCIICGKEIEKSRYGNAVLCSSECFNENFWNETLSDPNRLIVKHSAYYVGNEDAPSWDFRGFGGRAFYVKMIKDTPEYPAGTVFKSTNMWSNGTIPDEYDVQDNAEFISKSEYIELGGTE